MAAEPRVVIAPREVDWRCSACGLLLGRVTGEQVEIRYKTMRYVVRGEVSTTCRKCGEANAVNSVGAP